MKKLSMLLSVFVCSIGLFQSVKGMDDLSVEKTVLEKYLLAKHLLETSLPKDLVLFIRQLLVDIENQRLEKERLEKQRALEAAPKRGAGATFLSGAWNVVNRVDWAKHASTAGKAVGDTVREVGDVVDRETNKWKDAQQKRFDAEMKAEKEEQERIEKRLEEKELLFKRYLLERHLLKGFLPEELVSLIIRLQAAVIMEADIKANKEKQARLEKELLNKSLHRIYRAMLMRQIKEAEEDIEAAEAIQRQLQALLQ